MTQPPEDQLKALWKGQQREIEPMSVEMIRARAMTFEAKMRLFHFIGVGISLGAGVFFAYLAWRATDPVIRAGDLVLLAATPWTLWRLSRRRPLATPGLATAAGLLEFHRRQILRELRILPELLLVAAPSLAGLLVLMAGMLRLEGGPRLAHWAPILGFLAIWAVAFAVLLRRQRRWLRRRLSDLDAQGV